MFLASLHREIQQALLPTGILPKNTEAFPASVIVPFGATGCVTLQVSSGEW